MADKRGTSVQKGKETKKRESGVKKTGEQVPGSAGKKKSDVVPPLQKAKSEQTPAWRKEDPSFGMSGLVSRKSEDVSYEWQQDLEETMEAAMAERGDSLPNMAELKAEAEFIKEKLERHEMSKSKGREAEKSDDDDFDKLIMEQVKQLEEDTEATPTQYKKPVFSDSPTSKDSKKVEYQESFTSQQETAELRDEISSMSSRLANMEKTIEGLLQERKNLPSHLERLTSNITSQFTIMNDRLNSAIEAGMPTESAQQISEQVVEMASTSSKVLDTVRDDLVSDPNKHSQVSQTKPITGKKKKIRLFNN